MVLPLEQNTMNKETYEALKVLVSKIERHVAPATYQEDTREAVAVVKEWMDKVAEDYEENSINVAGTPDAFKKLFDSLPDRDKRRE